MTKCSKKVSMKWTSLLAQGWTKIPGAQQKYSIPHYVIEIEEFYSYNKAWIKSVVVHLLAVLNVLKPNIGFILLFILL